ncbi:uncharacterized protein EV420DRAFT_1480024 [Desarmillaria tabescens]|uniref:Uncharacterized protein n=1 Tax=Armillaria tabescens TaxID=1929756 RepID=A0AA39KEF4_ARMTA|nr:uncharacterized protein EV420DRAFT_1480024 [Desarmillaria tabescens]KAK0458289.1 hypothetical protein EV420DRAFT_1480024 [Desarmillaria tabescens]
MYEMKKGVSTDIEMAANYEGSKSSSSSGVLPLSLHPNLGLQSQSEDRIDSSRFGAVLIGIDGYLYHPLHGCLSDAKLMGKYIVEDLGVSKNRIQLFLGASGGEVNLDLDALAEIGPESR